MSTENSGLQGVSLDHVAFAVENWSQAGPVLAERFGGVWLHGLEQPAFNPCQLAYANGMRVELMEVGLQPNSFIRRFLLETQVHARAHHVTFKVPDINKSIALSTSLGFEPILVNVQHESWKELFLHPKETGLGFLIQIVQAAGEIRDSVPESMLIGSPWTQPLKPASSLPVFVSVVEDMNTTDIVLRDLLGAQVTQHLNISFRHEAALVSVYRWEHGAQLMVVESDANEIGIGLLAFRSDGALTWHPRELIQALDRADFSPLLGVKIIDLSTEVYEKL